MPTLALIMALAGAASADITLNPTGSFALVNNSAGGLAADDTTVYVTHVGRPEMDRYSTAGGFLGTTALTGVSTLLGGYTGAAVKDGGELYLTAMFDSSREAAVYTFTKTGGFLAQANISPAIRNTTAIGFDGASVYASQNDSPNYAYMIDPVTGAIQTTYNSNPGHGQRLGIAYWAGGDVLIESYDRGIAVLDPADGSELQFLDDSELGYDAQTFAVDVRGDTLYFMTTTRVYTYTIAPDCAADLTGDGTLDADDFFAYLDLFAAGDPDADIDGDGDIDADDFFAYLDLFAAGC